MTGIPRLRSSRVKLTGIHGIAGEAGDGFCKDHVDLALPALPDHAEKILALAGGSASDTLIRKDIRHRPVGICHDFFRVICFLVFIAAKLLVLFRRHTAVCSYPEIFLLFLILRRFLLCRDDNASVQGGSASCIITLL